jgi:hypothetical protein
MLDEIKTTPTTHNNKSEINKKNQKLVKENQADPKSLSLK